MAQPAELQQWWHQPQLTSGTAKCGAVLHSCGKSEVCLLVFTPLQQYFSYIMAVKWWLWQWWWESPTLHFCPLKGYLTSHIIYRLGMRRTGIWWRCTQWSKSKFAEVMTWGIEPPTFRLRVWLRKWPDTLIIPPLYTPNCSYRVRPWRIGGQVAVSWVTFRVCLRVDSESIVWQFLAKCAFRVYHGVTSNFRHEAKGCSKMVSSSTNENPSFNCKW